MSGTKECVFDVRERGASGDGRTPDTAAIQAAIGACHRAGGGMVYCPPGDYLVGSLELKSNVNLHLEAGSQLVASSRREDYRPLELGVAEAGLNYNEEHLIFARGAENVAVSGMGTVDGRGDQFHGPAAEGSWHLSAKGWRPFQMVAFVECRNVLIENVTFRNAPAWTIWPLGCDGVRITGVKIFNNRWGPNTDGIDPDCCRNVTISDCVIDCGDDCIAVKSSAEKLGRRGGLACEDLAVTNCTLSTSCCGIRLGYEGDAPIRNCTFSNIVMRKARTGINMLVPRNVEGGLDIRHGPTIENVSFSNIVMDTRVPFFLWIGDDASRPGAIRNITFSDIRATTERGCYLGGSSSVPLEGLKFSNVELTVRGEMDDEFAAAVPYPYRVWGYLLKNGPNAKRGIPHALYFRDARDVALRDVRVRWGEVSGSWRSALRCERVEGLSLDGLAAGGAPGPAGAPAVHLSGVKGAFLRGCRAEAGAGAFLRADGGTEQVSVLACDLSAAGRPFEAPEGSLFESGNRLRRRS